jgi:malate synthase
VLAPAATAFVDRLHRELNPERVRLLAARESKKGLR